MDRIPESTTMGKSPKSKTHFSVKFGISLIVAIFFAFLLTAAFYKLDVLCNAFNVMHIQIQEMQSDVQQINNLLEQKYGSRTTAQ